MKKNILAVSLVFVAVALWARVLTTSDASDLEAADLESKLVSVEPPGRLEAILVGRASRPTDIQFIPGREGTAVVLEKDGRALILDVKTGETSELFTTAVRTGSELGLLGLAFHPRYLENGRFYLNTNPADGTMRTEISEWAVSPEPMRERSATKKRVLLEVTQPYANHDAGQLVFGPDGMLYVGFGDGGSASDPQGHGQDPDFLGGMLRIDVDGSHDLPIEGPGFRRGRYGIPKDNPKMASWPPETFAIGLRNPWRYTFDPKGRLIVADVGQSAFEEIDVVSPGANLGWNSREGRHCHSPQKGCATNGLVDPVYEYGRELGGSVTGGYVIPARTSSVGEYVFADFSSGRFFALDVVDWSGGPMGRLPISPSTFGFDQATRTLYVADFSRGGIYRLKRSEAKSE
ncbi:MAG: PQQ-dependent sugar dehydrogenase [Deltaproteobacteria bacterium]|nr:PQQ-dependent sugar dehydrogenase [Deltaproteobacteria bacterium]